LIKSFLVPIKGQQRVSIPRAAKTAPDGQAHTRAQSIKGNAKWATGAGFAAVARGTKVKCHALCDERPAGADPAFLESKLKLKEEQTIV
jgi:hypothetical protein